MPTYQYACTACGHDFETVQSFSDAPLTDCPQCQGRLRKVFSPVGVVFKGSGFYRTDSRSSGSGKSKVDATGADKPGPTATESSSGTSAGSTSDAAPAAPAPKPTSTDSAA